MISKEYIRECPRCHGTGFIEHDCGPDTYDDDISYISFSCRNCGLWYSGWTDKWLIDCDGWRDEENGKEFILGSEESGEEGD